MSFSLCALKNFKHAGQCTPQRLYMTISNSSDANNFRSTRYFLGHQHAEAANLDNRIKLIHSPCEEGYRKERMYRVRINEGSNEACSEDTARKAAFGVSELERG